MSLHRRTLIFYLSLFLGILSLMAQNSPADKYYQDKLSSYINIGKELLNANEVD